MVMWHPERDQTNQLQRMQYFLIALPVVPLKWEQDSLPMVKEKAAHFLGVCISKISLGKFTAMIILHFQR